MKELRYRKHVVQHDDTVQYIAQKYYGSPTQWEKIVEYNTLEYPYIVYDTDRKVLNPEHWVTIGDTLIIPVEQSMFDNEETRQGIGEELILSLALGRDLNIIGDAKPQTMHNSVDKFGLVPDEHGDVAVVSGVENIKQATIKRLMTPRGSLLLHPNYGSTITQFLGSNTTRETLTKIDTEIQATIKKDSRIQEVTLEHSEIAEEGYRGEFTVTLYSTDYYFDLIIEGDNEGNLVLY